MRCRLVLLLIAFAAALGALPVPAAAHDRLTGHAIDSCVLLAPRTARAAEILRTVERFRCVHASQAPAADDVWVLSDPLEDVPDAAVVRVTSVWQQRLTLHVLYADGRVTRVATDRRAPAARPRIANALYLELPPHPARAVRLLWKVEGSANRNGVQIGQRIVTLEQSHRLNFALALLYAGFVGLCIAAITYNLALWTALRHRFQLAYCTMLFWLLLYAASSSGALGWLVPDLGGNNQLLVSRALLCWTAAAALAFSRLFFEQRVLGRGLTRGMRLVSRAMAAIGVAFLLCRPDWFAVLDRIFSAVLIAVIGVVATMLWRGWRRSSDHFWMFALSWAAPIVSTLLRTLHNMGLIGNGVWLDNSTIIAMAAESLCMAAAIAFRIRILGQERDEAVRQEALARRLADIDPLTGLLNRRAFLTSAIGRTGEQRLMVLDLDHFKQINDAIGHDGGDEVLRVCARALRRLTPPGALATRLGGEEFALLLPAGTAPDPETVLAELRAARMPFDLTVTASVGSCTGPIRTETDWKRLYRNADRALFEAKAAGRDRSRIAPRAA